MHFFFFQKILDFFIDFVCLSSFISPSLLNLDHMKAKTCTLLRKLFPSRFFILLSSLSFRYYQHNYTSFNLYIAASFFSLLSLIFESIILSSRINFCGLVCTFTVALCPLSLSYKLCYLLSSFRT